MRVIAVVSACLALAGYGRRVRMTGQGPTNEAGVSGRVGASVPKDPLASLLTMRGGYYDDMRYGRRIREFRDGYEGAYLRRARSLYGGMRGGYVGSLPMTPYRSSGGLRSTRDIYEDEIYEDEDLDDYNMESVYDDLDGYNMASVARRLRRGFAGLRRGIQQPETALVQGGSLKTWSFPSSFVDRVQVELTTDGRPLDADVQLWQGPDNTPCKMRVYSEDGAEHPFHAVIATPERSGGDKTVAIRNVAQIEFPLNAYVSDGEVDFPFADIRETSVIVQGGSVRTFNFDTVVESVEIMLLTDGRPLNARIELIQGPNNNKQVVEIQTEDGLERPFFAVIDTMGSGNVVRVVNTAPMEFPMTASVQPHVMAGGMMGPGPVMGGGY